MNEARTRLIVGTRVLTNKGAGVLEKTGTGWAFRNACGELEDIGFSDNAPIREINRGEIAAVTEALRPTWDALDDAARRIALDRLEVVQEVLTGYRDGLPELARKGEPRWPFGPGYGVSEARRCDEMAKVLAQEHCHDRALQRRIQSGELQDRTIGASTIRRWVKNWKDRGLKALIDGRSLRARNGEDRIDLRYREVAMRVLATLDGDISTVSIVELRRRIDVQIKREGINSLHVPVRGTGEYLSALKKERGTTTRAQASRALRQMSGMEHFPAVRPGQVVAIDATRADNLVYSPLSGKPYSVEILTAIDVATRVVLALRVVPRSATGTDAGLLVYDVCRPFSMQVSGTTVSDWRWGGLPEQLDLSGNGIRVEGHAVLPDFSTLQGSHAIPSVLPDAIHTDRGVIFVGWVFRAILQDLGIDLLLSRGRHPTDNPHVERWHETLQRGLQQIPGYKGRNTSERGRLVASEPLLTAHELQTHLKKWVASDYHRRPHDGLTISLQDEEEMAEISPLEWWDALAEFAGRIDVPQTPDLIYQFLPIRWLTINHQGVEWKNLVYDAAALTDYRTVRHGFRERDDAAPFYVDPRDMSRIWFRDPKTSVVQPIPWRGAARTEAPMTAGIVAAACRRIRARGGNKVLTRHLATRQIIDELTELTHAPTLPRDWGPIVSATLRVEQSRADHDEAQRAIREYLPTKPSTDPATMKPSLDPETMYTSWPDLLADD